MNKIGIERRFFVAGQKKDLDLSPLKDGDKKVAEELLADLHKTFIEGDEVHDKLKSSQVFSGLVRSGKKSLELGLTDGLPLTS